MDQKHTNRFIFLSTEENISQPLLQLSCDDVIVFWTMGNGPKEYMLLLLLSVVGGTLPVHCFLLVHNDLNVEITSRNLKLLLQLNKVILSLLKLKFKGCTFIIWTFYFHFIVCMKSLRTTAVCLFLFLQFFGFFFFTGVYLTIYIYICFFTGVYLTYNVVLVLGVQQSESVIHTHISILFRILFPYRPPQNMEQVSLSYTVGPCYLFILYIVVQQCVYANPNPPSYSSPQCFPFGMSFPCTFDP